MSRRYFIPSLLLIAGAANSQPEKADTLSVSAINARTESAVYLNKANSFHKKNNPDSAIFYAKKAFAAADTGKNGQGVLDAGKTLAGYYDEYGNLPAAYKYLKLTIAVSDSLRGTIKAERLLPEKPRQPYRAGSRYRYLYQNPIYLLAAGLALLLLLVFILWRSGRRRKRDRLLLEKKEEDIEAALNQLQLTQNQLIQAEKMASLGELTAGIAHEIQNPLNFVNNFSEINLELLKEMENELANGDKNEAISIVVDIKQNLEKIRHHGRRADDIVKGMLQHSRASSSTRELTNINALAEEYIRLAYHGLRAKDKSFNTELTTKYDDSLPLIQVIPQDIGRVLLNLFTNAFYAVQQKQKTTGVNYKPEVTLTTSKANNQILINVTDNGVGIADTVKDKIMQPFFTTKPSGEGTGLGLSLSYDIVVKGHGGDIYVDSKDGEYTSFTVSLPVN